jgi:hypothetical protein
MMSGVICGLRSLDVTPAPAHQTQQWLLAATKANRQKKKAVLGFVSIVWVKKPFDTIYLQILFCIAFELPSVQNSRKRDKPKTKSRKNFYLITSVFELPLPRKTKKARKKKSAVGPSIFWSEITTRDKGPGPAKKRSATPVVGGWARQKKTEPPSQNTGFLPMFLPSA